MTEQEVNNFEYSVQMTEKLFDYLQVNLENKIKKTYTMSYAMYVRKSKLGQCDIRIDLGKKWVNSGISFSAMLCETDKPFMFHLWKYNGEHFFQDEQIKDIKEKDFPTYLDKIRNFFDLNTKHGFEQLTLF